ncbi:hypothetical protein ZWY2020_007160 [Hordeum vulgare]|nr:hypothetical protein ZWY2020_007160 [Hordeum vulgare]
MMHKKMVNGGRVKDWICINFSRNVQDSAAGNFCHELAGMCQTSGMDFSVDPLLPPLSARPEHVERALKARYRDAMNVLKPLGRELDLLVAILHDNNGSLYEGVDLIEKGLKNMIRWKGFDMLLPKEVERQTCALKEELHSSRDEECRLDEEIQEAQEKLRVLRLNRDKKSDCIFPRKIFGSTLIAINAPHGTCVEVPDPNADMDICKDLESQEKHYRLLLRSSMGPIDCYLLSDHQEVSNPEQVAQDNLDHASAAGGSDAPRPVDGHPSQAPEKGEGDTIGKDTSEPSSTHELMPGILRIVPPDTDIDADYWLASDVDATMTKTWAT